MFLEKEQYRIGNRSFFKETLLNSAFPVDISMPRLKDENKKHRIFASAFVA